MMYSAIVVILAVLTATSIIDSVKYRFMQDVDRICGYPEFESCENLYKAKTCCEPAEQWYEKKNCSVTDYGGVVMQCEQKP